MRFQTKLMLSFIFLLLVVVGLMAFFSYETEKLLLGEVESNLQEIVNTVHFSTRNLTMEKSPDREFLERFIQEFKSKKGVKEVSIVSNHREVIASSNPKIIGHRERALSGKEIVVQEQLGLQDSTGHRIRYEVRVPLIRDDRVIGLVQTSIALTDFRALLKTVYHKNIGIVFIALLVACGASFLILKQLNKPLRLLSEAADRIAQGDLTGKIDSFNNDEMMRLAKAFNGMILKLAEQKGLEKRLRHLERQAILAEMAATLAHEIRNPLNLINLTADHLGDQYPPEESQRRLDYLSLVGSLKAEVKHLNSVVGEFLNLGRSQKLHKSTFNFGIFMDQISVMIKQQLTTKDIAFTVNCPNDFCIFADEEQFRLVILNILLNAIDAVPNQGAISITSSIMEKGKTSIAIVDNGIGVTPGDLEKIFEAYFTNREGGTGLGLALVKRIVEEHGGIIKAENVKDGGLKLELQIPGVS